MKFKDIVKMKDIAIHAETQEQAITLCRYAHDLGLKWCGGESYLIYTLWNEHKENTCYNFYTRTLHSKILEPKNKFKIIPFEDVEFEPMIKFKLERIETSLILYVYRISPAIKENDYFKASNGFELYFNGVATYFDNSQKSITLNSDMGTQVTGLDFGTEQKAKAFEHSVLQAFKEWKENGYSNDKKYESLVTVDNIYEF